MGLGAGVEGTEHLAPTMIRSPDTYESLVLLILEEKKPFLTFNPTSVTISMYNIRLQKTSINTCKTLTDYLNTIT